jgi:hypothetical protein
MPIFINWQISRRGIDTTAVVTAHKTEGGESDSYFVYVNIPKCECIAKVQVGHLSAHPIGSELPVRYDPHDPTHARARSDAAGGSDPWTLLTLSLLVAVGLTGFMTWRRIRRNKGRALVTSGAPSRPVRFQLWKRPIGGEGIPTAYYLGAFPTDDRALDTPLLWIRVRRSEITGLRTADVIEMFGSGVPGDLVAFRAGDVVISAYGPTRPGPWEAESRTQTAEK